MRWDYLPSLPSIYVVTKTDGFLKVKVIFFLYYIIIQTYPHLALLPGYQGEELGSPLPIFEPQIQENSDSSRYFMSREKWQIILNTLLLLYCLWKPWVGIHSHQARSTESCFFQVWGAGRAFVTWHQWPSWTDADTIILRDSLCSQDVLSNFSVPGEAV